MYYNDSFKLIFDLFSNDNIYYVEYFKIFKIDALGKIPTNNLMCGGDQRPKRYNVYSVTTTHK